MNIALVDNWNKIVKPEDTVYHLGDVTWGPFDINCLNGKKVLVVGNHDNLSQIGHYFEEVAYYKELRGILPKGRKLILMHYNIESWNGKFHKSIHLHGHCHGTCDNTGLLRWDVGVDCWNMKPVHLDQILAEVPKREEENAGALETRLRELKERDSEFKHLNEVADADNNSR